MKVSIEFIKANITLFQAILAEDGLDYVAFYPVGELYAIAESWEDVHQSTLLIDVKGII